MDNILQKIQKIEYDILKELDRICKKHNIKYFLGQGTLLGAAKYKGFIPWDDDIDLLIPYDELERLIKVFPQETNKNYMITNHKIEKHYPLPWAKIRALDTLSRPKRYKELPINWGICIDLFPIYPLSNFKPLRKLEILSFKIANKMLMAEMTKYEDNHGALERFLEKIPICIRHLFLDSVTTMLSLHNKSEYVWIGCKGGKVVKYDMIFAEEKQLTFEDETFAVPSDYHNYLTLNYGDYMAPLPEDQQKGHELKLGEIEWKL